jgi:hypothetical protein
MSWLYAAPLPVVVLLVVVLVVGALETGYRLGRVAPVKEQQVSSLAAAILGVVGLLLAFSFGMASDRLALRRAMVVQETNSIGTFWLRTSLVPEPIRSDMRARVRRYVDLHFEHREAGIDQAEMSEVQAEVQRLQRELWALLDRDAQQHPEASRLRLVVPALNAMIDDTASVQAAKENRLPDALLVFQFVLVIVAAMASGYRPRGEKRNVVLWAMFVLVLGGVLTILLDIDRPRRGLIQSDPAPYLRLRESITQ